MAITDYSTGAFTYTPTRGKSGTDTFTCIANDGQLNSNVATVTVTIIPVPLGTDLTMTAISAPAAANAGTSIVLSNTVTNIGANAPTVAFSIGFYLSTDSAITTADTYLGS